jgi:hypothetical protein
MAVTSHDFRRIALAHDLLPRKLSADPDRPETAPDTAAQAADRAAAISAAREAAG